MGKRILSEKEIAEMYGLEWGKDHYWGGGIDTPQNHLKIQRQIEEKHINIPFSIIEFETSSSLIRFYFYHDDGYGFAMDGIVDYFNKDTNKLVARRFVATISDRLLNNPHTLSAHELSDRSGIKINISDLEKAVIESAKLDGDTLNVREYNGLPVKEPRRPTRYRDEDRERDSINRNSATSGIAGLLYAGNLLRGTRWDGEA